MRVNVAGAGAIGLLIGARLAEAGLKVQMITRTAEQAAAIRNEGIRLSANGDEQVFVVDATSQPRAAGEGDLAVLAMKSYDLERFVKSAEEVLDGTAVLFLQNGMAHLPLASSFPEDQVAFGTVEHGAQRTGLGSVKHTGTGPIRISTLTGNFRHYLPLLAADSPAFPLVLAEQGPRHLLLAKAMKNCLINPVTALANVRNGKLAEDPALRSLLGRLHSELVEAFPEMAHTVTLDGVFDLCSKTADNTSSMLADFLEGRKTESEAIMGSLLSLAKERGASLPTLEALSDLVLSIERGRLWNG